MLNEHITSLGFSLEFSDEENDVQPLLQACQLEATAAPTTGSWPEHQFLRATTAAGGTAACLGYSRSGTSVVLHSLAVAPSSRGSGIAVGILAALMSELKDNEEISGFYITSDSSGVRRMFSSAGFSAIDIDVVPPEVLEHPEFKDRDAAGPVMARTYGTIKRGLDNCAFQLIVNETEDATLPLGSVFFFRQTGNVIESSYRGGPVVRGHLLGAISGDQLNFCWQQYLRHGELASGNGSIVVEPTVDGRRELRNTLSESDSAHVTELLLREI